MNDFPLTRQLGFSVYGPDRVIRAADLEAVLEKAPAFYSTEKQADFEYFSSFQYKTDKFKHMVLTVEFLPPETAEDLLRDWLKKVLSFTSKDLEDFTERARRIVGNPE